MLHYFLKSIISPIVRLDKDTEVRQPKQLQTNLTYKWYQISKENIKSNKADV